MSQDLMPLSDHLPTLRNPNEIVEEAKARANVLMQIVKEKDLSKKLGNKEHIQIEAWQTVGAFFNCTAGADEAEAVEVDGIKGAKAHAYVTDERTGKVVSQAVAFCLRDEPNWRQKPWFQVASMAQTRAMSKALANKFRWVAVLAGYSGTPAEEMTGEEHSVYVEGQGTPPTSTTSQAAFIWRLNDKHKGESIATIPEKDLEWYVKHGRIPEYVERAIEELDKRRGQGALA